MHDFPTDPTPDTLSFYITYMSHYIKPDTVDKGVSRICRELEPYFPNVHLNRKSPLVQLTMEGCQRLYGQRRALTTKDLEAVLSLHQTAPSHDDLLFCAMLLTGFFGLMRVGELTDSDTRNLRDPCKRIKRTSVEITENTYSFFLPGHKGDRFFSGNTITMPKNDEVHDPHDHFLRYLRSRDERFMLLSPLWVREDGSTPTRSWFTGRLRDSLGTSIGGYSMRAGGATLLAEFGTAPQLIQAAGRWKSEDAWVAYVRKHPVLIQALVLSRRA